MRSPTASATALAEPAPAVPTTTTYPTDATIRVYPFRFDPELSVEVPLLRWPGAAALRERLASTCAPCLLVVGPTDRAPVTWTELEDWVRQTASRTEFVIRATTVARRADLLSVPFFARDRTVHFRGRAVVVPSTQAPLVSLLVERFGTTVCDAEVRSLCEAGGVSVHGEAVKTALRRLKDTLAPAGLRLTRVRSAGYLLDRAD